MTSGVLLCAAGMGSLTTGSVVAGAVSVVAGVSSAAGSDAGWQDSISFNSCAKNELSLPFQRTSLGPSRPLVKSCS